jgi:hypothetical protein
MEYNQKLEEDGFGWNGVWKVPMTEKGYDIIDIYANAKDCQQKWVVENGIPVNYSNKDWIEKILEAQLIKLAPDIIFSTDVGRFDNNWIESIKGKLRKKAIFIGHICSPFYSAATLTKYTFIVTCLKSVLQELKHQNTACYYLPHAFDTRILNKINAQYSDASNRLCFIGGIVRTSKVHHQREQLLTQFAEEIEFKLLSEISYLTPLRNITQTYSRFIAFQLVQLVRMIGISNSSISKIPVFGGAARWESVPSRPISTTLINKAEEPVFGINMFNTLLQNAVILNIHGDFSSQEAANMRMFEVTGVGSCLLTDWKPNIKELFIEDKEIVTYRTYDECLEKAKWLLAYPSERKAIAENGRLKALISHTYFNRSIELDQFIRKHT